MRSLVPVVAMWCPPVPGPWTAMVAGTRAIYQVPARAGAPIAATPPADTADSRSNRHGWMTFLGTAAPFATCTVQMPRPGCTDVDAAAPMTWRAYSHRWYRASPRVVVQADGH